MRQLSVLLLGNTDRPEFAEARKALDGLARVIPAVDVDAACGLLTWADDELALDAIVVAQAYPGQFSGDALDRLSRLAPLARVVELLGSWCEGEVRSGRPWPGAVRVYWHQWLPRCHQELTRMADGLLSSWCLPPTASDEERLLAAVQSRPPLPDGGNRGPIAIYSRLFEMRDWLSQACRRAGYTTVAVAGGRWQVAGGESKPHFPPTTYDLPSLEGTHAAIFDAFDCRGEELEELRQWADELRPAPVIVLMSFPRVEDRDRVLSAGAAGILSKPLALEDLSWQVENCRSFVV